MVLKISANIPKIKKQLTVSKRKNHSVSIHVKIVGLHLNSYSSNTVNKIHRDSVKCF
jgi:hypothetical protein